jgi:hypothetical protein
MFRKLIAFFLILLLAVPVFAGDLSIQEWTLFNGNAATGTPAIDTAEAASPWIPVQGATRVFFRSWTAKAAFSATTDADSQFTDTITSFRVAFTDSVSNTNPLIAGDSVVIASTNATTIDTLTVEAMLVHTPISEPLRGPANGSGVITWVMPVTPGLATADNNGYLAKRYMRVFYTPRTRSTVLTTLSTTPNRTRGLKALRMRAYVIRANR